MTPAVNRSDAAPPRPQIDDLPPGWLARPLAAGLGLLAAASVVGVVAAMAGAFEPAIVVGASLVLGVPLAVAAATALPRWSSPRSVHASAALVVGVVAAITVYNGLNHSEHVVADRDPGVYLTTARHLVANGDLLVTGPSGPFLDAPGVSPNGAGFSPTRDDGTLEPQFPHLTAVVLALGGWVAEAGLFLLTPLIAGVALLCLYAWATTVVGPRWAGLAVVVTGVSMPFMVFARDTYSEPIAMVLVMGGLWLLHVADRSERGAVWFLSGLLLGASSMARVDGYLYLAPVLLALALVARLTGPERRRATGWGVGLCGLGLAATSAIGFWDTATLTGGYYESGLAPRLPAMLLAAAAAAVGGWLLAPVLWQRHRPRHGTSPDEDELRPTRWLQGALAVAAVAAAGFFTWAYWVRPDDGGIPDIAVEGLPVLSYLPQAATLSLHWFEWYLGPLGLVAGLAGLLWSLLRLGRAGRPDPAVVAGLGAALVTLLLYLWSPSITPDHPWAMRRFATVALPGLALGAAATGRALWAAGRTGHPDATGGRRVRAGRALRPLLGSSLALAVAVGTAGSTAAITWNTRGARAQVPMRDRIGDICEVIDDDAAILVPIDGILALMMSVPVGVWCEVPSAGGTTALEAIDVARLAVEWEEEGRRLVVLSSSATPLENTLLASGLVSKTVQLAPVFPVAIEPTITRRPREVVVDGRLGKGPRGEVTFYVYEIDGGAARRMLSAAPGDGDPQTTASAASATEVTPAGPVPASGGAGT